MKTKLFRSRKARKGNLWYFHITARNGRVVAQSEGYKRIGSAIKTLRRIYGSSAQLSSQLDEAIAEALVFNP